VNHAEIVSRFLGSVGRPAEAEYYLRHFRSERRESFAVICVHSTAVKVAGAMAGHLEFLSQLGLFPVVTFKNEKDAAAIAGRLAADVPAEISAPERALEVARSGRIPLVPIDNGKVPALVAETGTRKVIFLGARSGLMRADGTVPSLLDLTTEYDEIMASGQMSPGQARLLKRAQAIIEHSQGRVHVVITSPLDLLRELFTVRGAGTLVRQGARIQKRNAYGDTDRSALTSLIDSAFGKKLRPDYFDAPIQTLYIADEYRGAAIIKPTKLGPYLSKFVVDVAAQGEGIGRDLWRAIVQDVPSLFWRARKGNPIIAWYEQQCDGMAKTERWHIFWRNLPRERIAAAIEYAEGLPADLT
jgi:hypothetical protein